MENDKRPEHSHLKVSYVEMWLQNEKKMQLVLSLTSRVAETQQDLLNLKKKEDHAVHF